MIKYLQRTIPVIAVILATPSFAEEVYYCELIKFVDIDADPPKVKEFSGNKFKFSIRKDQLDFSDENYVFSNEYDLTLSYIDFRRDGKHNFFYKSERQDIDESIVSIETIRFSDGKLEGILYMPTLGGITYSISDCDRF